MTARSFRRRSTRCGEPTLTSAFTRDHGRWQSSSRPTTARRNASASMQRGAGLRGRRGEPDPGRCRQAVLPHQPPHPPKGEPPPPASSRSIFVCDTSRARSTKGTPRQRAAASTTARSPAGLEPGAWDRLWTGARSPPATRPRPTAPARARRGLVAPEPHVQAAQTVRTACASVARQCFFGFFWCGRH